MILDLVDRYSLVLRQPTQNFNFQTDDPVQLAIDLTETMLSHNGLGLAAPQVGIGKNVFVMAANPVIAVFNPMIVFKSEEEIELLEGCISFEQMFFTISRPREIRVRYSRPNGEVVTEKMTGMTARIFQHEFDHCQGRLFTDYMSQFKVERETKRAAKQIRLGK